MMKWIVILFLDFLKMYYKVQILVIWNNHEYGVLMNGNVMCVEKRSKNNECMHVKCKYVVTLMWNNYAEIKFHFCHLVTILWGIFNVFSFSIRKIFHNFYRILLMKVFKWVMLFFFSIQNLKGYVRKYQRFKWLMP
jgi:hypothetical protein